MEESHTPPVSAGQPTDEDAVTARRPPALEPTRDTWGGLAPTVDRATFQGGTQVEGPSAAAADFVMPGYEILGVLGRGGMGVVYKARQVKTNRIVALKMILGSRHADPIEKARFQIEVEAIARLQHPNIVQLHEAGEHDGQPYFSLEFCDGGSLDRKLNGQPLPPTEAAALVETLARAIQSAHARGVVHRDLKPANVLLRLRVESGKLRVEDEPSGPSATLHFRLSTFELKITDFGLAKRTDADSDMSRSGAIMGTPSYMAPEQAGGRVREIGPAADVYALGALLYECLTGRPPFRGETALDTLRLVVSEEPVPPSYLNGKVPGDLETICLKCLQKEAGRRYGLAEGLAEDLRRFRAGEPITARPVGKAERLLKWVRRKPASAGLVAAAVALVVVVCVSLGVVYAQLLKTQAALDDKDREQRERLKAERGRSLARLNALRDAAPGAVPGLLAELEASRADILPRLRELWAEGDVGDPARRMRLAMALLPVEPETVRDDLAAWLLRAGDPAEVLLVRDLLTTHSQILRERFWEKAGDKHVPPDESFRALVALAAFDPEDRRWSAQAPDAVAYLMKADPLHLGPWVAALRPVAADLVPPLSATYRTAKSSDARERAATVLAEYAAENPEVLTDLLLDADGPQQYLRLLPAVERHPERAAKRIREELAIPTPDPNAPITAPEIARRERLARRQATGAVTLLKLGAERDAWPLFRHQPDPEARSQFIYRAGLLGADPKILIRRLSEETDVSARRALILTLGEFNAVQLPPETRGPVVELLLKWYRDDPDPGIHGAVDWLLRQGREGNEARPLNWNQGARLRQIETELRRGDPDDTRLWYVNRQGLTMICVRDPAVFRMGSPPSEPGRDAQLEAPHRRSIGRNFALAAHPVTNREFDAYLNERGRNRLVLDSRQWSPAPNGPVVGTSWYEAAQYCNWLSDKEGLPESEWCYPRYADIKAGMKPFANYLQRKGYRLPTEAEWEYACRAGAGSSRYYGSSEELLPRYAWFLLNAQNHAWPVGHKRPNDLGLFDMHGNVFNWTQEISLPYRVPKDAQPLADVEDRNVLLDGLGRGIRGGSFVYPSREIRSAYRLHNAPNNHSNMTGFRPARTLS